MTNLFVNSTSCKMIPLNEPIHVNSRMENITSSAWFSLLAEFIIGIVLSATIFILRMIKSTLLKPPRDLTGAVVLVTGATSSLGRCLAEEFARGGCTIVCVDNDLELVRKIAYELSKNFSTTIRSVGPAHRKQDVTELKAKVWAYQCDLTDRKAISTFAHKFKDEIGSVIDVLITCTGNSGQDIFDTVNTTLMSHYWTVLAFLPSMIQQQRAYIIGVTPTVSIDDAFMGTRAAIAGLMESLSEEFGNRNNQLNFITVAQKTDSRLIKKSEQKVARDVVQAVRKGQGYLSTKWW
ncbi:hypothetical protein PV328_004988 [Microctonus aethiopoides]|uniref:Uncharacterized protein n=1 Tax=Microctonus aethiopoides TaxID=144406 RepID=A0AA39FLD5_9HYME|nr:hypothetical protein PV328_004988 [Microctonus aethiopoides]